MTNKKAEFWPLHDRWGWIPHHWMGLRWLALHHTVFYERFLAFIFPMKEFIVEMEIIKQ